MSGADDDDSGEAGIEEWRMSEADDDDSGEAGIEEWRMSGADDDDSGEAGIEEWRMSRAESRLLQTIQVQGQVCAAMGSSMYGDVLHQVAADVEADGVFAAILAGTETMPAGWVCRRGCSGGWDGWV